MRIFTPYLFFQCVFNDFECVITLLRALSVYSSVSQYGFVRQETFTTQEPGFMVSSLVFKWQCLSNMVLMSWLAQSYLIMTRFLHLQFELYVLIRYTRHNADSIRHFVTQLSRKRSAGLHAQSLYSYRKPRETTDKTIKQKQNVAKCIQELHALVVCFKVYSVN